MANGQTITGGNETHGRRIAIHFNSFAIPFYFRNSTITFFSSSFIPFILSRIKIINSTFSRSLHNIPVEGANNNWTARASSARLCWSSIQFHTFTHASHAIRRAEFIIFCRFLFNLKNLVYIITFRLAAPPAPPPSSWAEKKEKYS